MGELLWLEIVKISLSLVTLGGVATLAYIAGQWRTELSNLEEALNGDGPWQRKIDSTRAKVDKTREFAEKVREEMLAAERKRDKKCLESTRSLTAIQTQLDAIERQQERQKAKDE